MTEAGILAPDARVELIEGVIIDMPPIGTGHGGTVAQLNRLLFEAVEDRALIIPRSPIRLSDISEPVPDFTLARPRADFYKKKHPGPADTLLIIDVSQSSLRYDVEIKAPFYARHGIPEYWIVDLPKRQVRFFRSANLGKYVDVSATDTPGTVSPVQLP